MTLEQAERLKSNPDFTAFMELLETDVGSIKEDMITHVDPTDVLKDQIRVQTIRGVSIRLNHVIDSEKPIEPASAAGQGTV